MDIDAPVVIVIDDDSPFLRSTERLIREEGFNVLTFASAEAFLSSKLPNVPLCLLIDVRLPDLSGLDLQRQLIRVGLRIPIIFMTAHGDIPMSVRAMKAGAVGFLTKPFLPRDLFETIAQAIERSRAARKLQTKRAVSQSRYEMLTARERQIAQLARDGRSNQEIADDAGLSVAMVKKHLYSTFRKLQVNSRGRLIALMTLITSVDPPVDRV